MQSSSSHVKSPSAPGLKQVKVDNWGTFFLQRLQKLYNEEELLDLTIKFPTSDITVQAHRLVVTTCTDYFTQLEKTLREKDEDFDGILIMPPDMPYECVKSIISFMYTGQLEYWTSEQTALYRTAHKMNMTVLTKLLDAQFNTGGLPSPPGSSEKSMMGQKSSNSMKKLLSNQSMPETPLPGRKLPIWRRKLDSYSGSPNSDTRSYQKHNQGASGPSRFDLPEVDDIALGVFSSFDDITYNTKPIVQAGGRGAGESSAGDDQNRNNVDDDDDDDLDDSQQWDNSDDDWMGSKFNSRSSDLQPSPSKRVRFELEEKENMEKMKNASQNSPEAINNHAKIIREVLKKYPHLVKNNKNIRLKIMQKETKTADNSSGKTKVSYVVLKSDHLMSGNNLEEEPVKGNNDGAEIGPWKCRKCDLDGEYNSYYMYRRHMQDVHDEKFDPRVCEHCGYKATKRNILMYHLYTKHSIAPPKSMSFPKCPVCNYIALSETLLVRHQINHNHRSSSTRSQPAEELQCSECPLAFKDVNELTNHEINSGHGSTANGSQKSYRCPHCPKHFVRSTNLHVHIDCVHRDLREPEATMMPSIPLEPSSEAEALSHVASGIAASLGVGDASEHHEIHSNTNFLVSQMDLNNISQDGSYNGHEQGMIMLIDNGEYDAQVQAQQQPQQLEISGSELVMQGTQEGMIVYIHGNEEDSARQTYETYHEVGQETEEIVEEVVEEVEEEVLEEEVEQEGQEITADDNAESIEREIQYVEEEIVEFDEEQTPGDGNEGQESMMIIEEHLEGAATDDNHDKQKESQTLADEWDEDSIEMAEIRLVNN